MPRQSSKTIITTVAGSLDDLATARLANLQKARAKALELRLLRQQQQQPPDTATVRSNDVGPPAKPARKRIRATAVPPPPASERLDTLMQDADTGSGETITDTPKQSVNAQDQLATGDGTNVLGPDTPAVPPGAAQARPEAESIAPGARQRPANVQVSGGPSAPNVISVSPKTPASRVTEVPAAEEGELDPTPGPPTELARGRSKNNRRKPTTVKRVSAKEAGSGKSEGDKVRRKLRFDHIEVGRGAFYRDTNTGHFAFTR